MRTEVIVTEGTVRVTLTVSLAKYIEVIKGVAYAVAVCVGVVIWS